MAMSRSYPIQSCFVLGSTSEIARAICRQLARRGCRRFHLVARNAIENERLAGELRESFGVEVSLQRTELLGDAALGGCCA